jgi:hypothetical protein
MDTRQEETMSETNEMMRETNEIRTTDQPVRGAVGHFAAALTMARRAPDYFRAPHRPRRTGADGHNAWRNRSGQGRGSALDSRHNAEERNLYGIGVSVSS